jgi:hypothetical protein
MLHEYGGFDPVALDAKACERFVDYELWYGEDNIGRISEFATRMIRLKDDPPAGSSKGFEIGDPQRSASHHRSSLSVPILRWNADKTPILEDVNGVSWPYLGKEPSDEWRNKRTITWMSTAYGKHFMAVLICGPEKLVVPFDSFAGTVGDPLVLQVGRFQVLHLAD